MQRLKHFKENALRRFEFIFDGIAGDRLILHVFIHSRNYIPFIKLYFQLVLG